MKYRGVTVIKIETETYGFIYDGCPDKLLHNHYGDYLKVDSLDKAKGFIDCLIALGEI
tara:strand:+ start:732 stop:905 length:174 start_codon:yes stop_codon:yes gene_type:complete